MTTHRNIEDVYELTPLQQGLLFHCLQSPTGGYYVEQMHFTVRGEVRVHAIREAWSTILARHPALRSSFSWDDINRPVQVVHRDLELPLDEIDLRGVPADGQEEAFRALMLEKRRQGMDLESAPLFRLTLVQMADDLQRFVWQFSHLILDGWSFGVVMSEFVALYKASYHGTPVRLGPASGLRDYVEWWSRQRFDDHRGYWEQALDGYSPPPPLDLGDTPPPEDDDPVKHEYREIELGPFADELRELSVRRRLTLNTLVQGAWALVHSRCAGTDDIVIGATMAHRPAEMSGGDTIVGPLIVTVPIRTPVAQHSTTAEWLATVQQRVIEARDHGGAPLPEIHGWSGVPRSTPLFETIVSYENVPIPEISFAEVGMENLGHDVDGRPQYPMTLDVLPGAEMKLRLVFDRRRFTAATAERMLGRLRAALGEMVRDLDQPVGELDVRASGEREAVAAAPRTYEVGEGIVAEVRRRAAAGPDRVAVTDGEREVSYGELVAAAGKVASALVAAGVPAGGRVALCTRRTPDLVTGMLGVLTAGAAYVPLDPDNPRDRNAMLLAGSDADALLADTASAGALGPDDGTRPVTVPLDDLPDAPDADPREAGPDDVAYLMYTSGSTGTPKGVLVTHRNVVRLVRAAEDEFGIGPDDVFSCWFSAAFDGSSWEIWGALLSGATLVLASRDQARDPGAFLELLAGHRVSVATVTPSAFGQLDAAEREPETTAAGPALRLVVLGGERVDPSALRGWFDRHPDLPHVVNAYGPTEACVYVTAHRVLPGESREAAPRSLIGRPLPDVEIRLLDERDRPVPLGAPGEMNLCGPAVAAGYHDRADVTAERFAVDRDGPAGRRYRSGDLARWTDTGELEYLGRRDAQVKIRGVRVELGEIEHRLREHPSVAEAAVAARPDGTAVDAAVVPAGGPDGPGAVDTDDVRAFCARTLTEVMVPATVRAVERIPLTANGKLDRAALGGTAAGDGRPDPDTPHARTATERRLEAILCEIIGVDAIRPDDNLVDQGLHSLLATRVASRVRSEFRVGLKLSTLFDAPTLVSLAATIEAGGSPVGGSDRPGRPDLESEAQLPQTLAETVSGLGDVRWPSDPDDVFVTGATGFTAAFLVAELLETTSARVHCLVRAADPEQAADRLRTHLASLGLDAAAASDRLRAVPGDLSVPYLGLDRDTFDELADAVGHVFHFGAQVNFVHPYRRLRSSNVGGTLEVLRLAATGTPSVLHHASGIGVLAPASDGGTETARGEEPLAERAPELPNGYTESKWVSDRLVTEAGRLGLPVVVHRLGRVAGHSTAGTWQAAGDALGEMVRASVGLGLLPDFAAEIDIVPVDHVAAAVASLVRRPEAAGRILHLVNPRPPRLEEIDEGFRRAGHRFGRAGMDDWYAELVRFSVESTEDWSVAMTLLGEWTRHARRGMWPAAVDCSGTEAFFADGPHCPRVDAEVIARYLDHLTETGFVGAPGAGAEEEPWLATTANRS